MWHLFEWTLLVHEDNVVKGKQASVGVMTIDHYLDEEHHRTTGKIHWQCQTGPVLVQFGARLFCIPIVAKLIQSTIDSVSLDHRPSVNSRAERKKFDHQTSLQGFSVSISKFEIRKLTSLA